MACGSRVVPFLAQNQLTFPSEPQFQLRLVLPPTTAFVPTMSCQNDIPATQSRKQRYPFDTAPSLRACSSTRTWHSRLYSSPSLPSYSSSSQADTDLLDPLDDITLDIDLDQRTASSATLLSRRVSSTLSTHQLSNEPSCSFSEYDLSTRLSASRQSSFLYPLHEPGQRTAQRTQRLRARTAAVIMSIPATCEDVIDADDEAAQVPASKLRRVPGVRDLRRAFYDGDDRPAHVAPISLEPSKVCTESRRRVAVYSPGSLGFIRIRRPCAFNATIIPPVSSVLSFHARRGGQ